LASIKPINNLHRIHTNKHLYEKEIKNDSIWSRWFGWKSKLQADEDLAELTNDPKIGSELYKDFVKGKLNEKKENKLKKKDTDINRKANEESKKKIELKAQKDMIIEYANHFNVNVDN